MQDYQREISKEDYEKWTKMLSEDRDKAEKERFSDAVRIGYGLYGWFFREKDGKYFEVYTTGSSCD